MSNVNVQMKRLKAKKNAVLQSCSAAVLRSNDGAAA
jgi:hypothetical protein